eukprot:CAMPEP_0197519972 /NCGR_PEP_ID=MMETSP1318-20131121/5253_1 /TAXON_ID=552666 /ORGANISM="Partenskyella glossopodia, Strain RCC365" /LENGTH=554 /DNA_ID=CAMNT_0043071249 /DNA_START=591 /DNA_END=2255 /DNA_ORIENTATION=+
MKKPFHDSWQAMFKYIMESDSNTDTAHDVKCGYVLKLTGEHGLCDKTLITGLTKKRIQMLEKNHSDWDEDIKKMIHTAIGRVLTMWSTMKMPAYNETSDYEVSNAAHLFEQYAAESTLTDLTILTKRTSKVIDDALGNSNTPIEADVASTINLKLSQLKTSFDKNEMAVLTSAPMKKAVKTLGLMFIGSGIAAKLNGFGEKTKEKPTRTEKLIQDINKQMAAIDKQIKKIKGLGGKITMPDFVVECAVELDDEIFKREITWDNATFFTDTNFATYMFDIWAGTFHKSKVEYAGHVTYFKKIHHKLKNYLINHHDDQDEQNADGSGMEGSGMEVSASSSSSDTHNHGSLHDLKCLPTMYGVVGYTAHSTPRTNAGIMMPFLGNEKRTLESMLRRDPKKRPKVVDDGPKQARTVQPSCARYVLNQFLDWNEENSEFYDLKIKEGFLTKMQAQFKNITGWKSSKTDSVNKDVRDKPLRVQAIDIPSKCVASQVYAAAAKKPPRVDANCRMWQWCVRAMVSRICPTEPEIKDYIARLKKHQNPQPAQPKPKATTTAKK